MSATYAATLFTGPPLLAQTTANSWLSCKMNSQSVRKVIENEVSGWIQRDYRPSAQDIEADEGALDFEGYRHVFSALKDAGVFTPESRFTSEIFSFQKERNQADFLIQIAGTPFRYTFEKTPTVHLKSLQAPCSESTAEQLNTNRQPATVPAVKKEP